tara:strand:+ start:697 stop:2271 length:1575 start_codon:yes stop_codon:yes gene_type:complete
MNKIKIGIITNGKFVDKYTYDLAKWLKSNSKYFHFKNFISIPNEKTNFDNNKILKKIFFKLIVFFENVILKFTNKHKNHLSKFDIKNVVREELKIKILKRNEFNKKDLKDIKNKKFDILIRSCANILDKDFFKISKYGIISFHHGDYKHFRGSPAGFWEVFNKERKTGFMIQKINEGLDYGNIILEGFVQTKSFFLLNQAELYLKSNFYLKKFLLDFSKNKKFIFIKKGKKGKIYETPKIYNQIKYILQTNKILIKKLFFNKYNFKLALFKENNIAYPIVVKNDKNKFLADPFLIKHNNETYCFAEEYDNIKKRGHIVCINFKKEVPEKKIVLSENFHLSFPFIFKFKKNFFMCPDSSNISEIRLYKSVNFPLKWKLYKTIKKNIKAVDNIIFKKNNLWWLLTNIDRSNSGDFSHDLSIFYSKKGPLTEKWKSHPQNPIKTNSLESRNAGLIFEKNKIIRVSQVQGFDNYGESINFHEIKYLSTKIYLEKMFKNKNFIKIKKKLKNLDIHHYSKIDKSIIVDFK